MKKLIYLLSVTFLILQSCSSGDSNSANNNNNVNTLLFRKWHLLSSTFEGKTYVHKVCPNNGHRDYLEFKSPDIANYYYVASSSNNICSDEYALEPYNYTKNNNLIVIKYKDIQVKKLEIIELTLTSLKYISTSNGGGTALYEYSSY